jgi:hypothetical protein
MARTLPPRVGSRGGADDPAPERAEVAPSVEAVIDQIPSHALRHRQCERRGQPSGGEVVIDATLDPVLAGLGSSVMADTTDALVLDLVEWIGREPRLYSEVIATWRTSCPRLTIWEDAVDLGYLTRESVAGTGDRVKVTESGEKLLRAHGR